MTTSGGAAGGDMDDLEWLASIPEATDEEMAALVVTCRMGKRRCQATCHLTKRSDGKWYPPEGWGSPYRYGWYCPTHNQSLRKGR